MNKKALSTLEFNKICAKTAEFTDSTPAGDICMRMKVRTDITEIEELLDKTSDAVNRLLKSEVPSFGGNFNISPLIKQLEKGARLSTGELLRIASFLENVGRIRKFGLSDEELTDSLTEEFDLLDPLPDPVSSIRKIILAEDEISDTASSALSDIRRQIKNTNNKLHTQLSSLLNGSVRAYLMDPVITMRDDRYCLPVKAENKSKVPGIVHDRSSTGSTLFIEPDSIVKLNNSLKELSLEEQDEISRILASLCEELSPYSLQILSNARLMTSLDVTFAKAKYALSINAKRPVFSSDKTIEIRQGRHPLLDPATAVPIDITLGGDFSQLIITGPNTGGKTVTLKTLGLFTLMGQAGLFIPAGDRSTLALVKEVFADIGDEQSIEQSLSTFSSHMKNIISILNKADENSLCLFDELCAGTDPAEGAALAISILTTLLARKTLTAATTHYSELKLYALSTDGVENAGCEFDIETLSPTYRIFMGIPGKSNAFAIASRLGISESIIDMAKDRLSEENIRFEDVLSDIESARARLKDEELSASESRKEAENIMLSLKKREDSIEAERKRIIDKANEEARDILQEAKDLADETIRNFNKYGSAAPIREMEAARQKVGKKISDKNKALSVISSSPKTTPSLKPEDIKPGSRVYVNSLSANGYVESVPDKKGFLFVRCGIIRSKINIKDLSPAPEEDITIPSSLGKYNSGGKRTVTKLRNVSPEINLLGKTGDDAVAELDKYLDDAYLSHLPSVRIVHGKGTGALRTAVVSYLKRSPVVASFRAGEFGEGDAGVTIVTFKE